MKIEICSNTTTVAVVSVFIAGACIIGINGCRIHEQTQRELDKEAITAGLVQRTSQPDTRTTDPIWTKP